jgi:mono/diheme cytochrome c family protein
VAGGVVAILLQWWTNAIDYPFIVSGKPLFSLPANIPVTFEVIVLAAATTAFLGMLALNGLPKLANPILRSDRFRRATNDGFFLFVDATDNKFDPAGVSRALQEVNAVGVETIHELDSTSRIPSPIIWGSALVVSLALVPPVMIASARASKSTKPRLHNFFDMDFQPKFKSQTTTTLFADNRAMRPRIAGTIPRGQLTRDSRYYHGVESQDTVAMASTGKDAVADTATDTAANEQLPWTTEIPIPVTDSVMQRGRQRFNIHCAVCHGRAGEGNGLASLRALELQQGTWVPPTSIHAQHVREQPVGQLFHTITNGVRKMPAYGHQIPPEDRWAIVLYMRALQRSQNASIDDVPADKRITLREIN